MELCTNMAALAAMYTTRNTIFEGNPVHKWELLLPANPNRWWVQFLYMGNGGGQVVLTPGAPAGDPDLFGFASDRFQYKYDDCPSVVTGEWYTSGDAVRWYITECLYVGKL